jgi:type IV secretion system protein VirB5
MAKTIEQDQNAAYIAARSEWDERWGSITSREKMWRAAFFFEGVVILFLVIALMSVVRKSTVVPYVVAVDSLHQVIATGLATESQVNDPLIIQTKLAQYVENARGVSNDSQVEKARLEAAFAATNSSSPAFQYLKQTWIASSPFALAQSTTVEVNVHRVLQISPKSYQVDWTETRRSAKDGSVQATEEWKAILGVVISPPKNNDATLMKNPLGIYITSISWSKGV